jgi:drug/metabolite transporter (DMT)-like permease
MRRLFAFLRANPISKGFRRLSPITRACILMVLATLLFAAMHAAIRYVAQRISGMEVAFFRNLFGLIVIVPVLARYGPRLFYTEKLKLHVLRACINALSMISFFVGLSMTPIARATALSFTAPLFAALLSALFLGEVFRWRRWSAIFLGFFGALVILRPGLQALDLGSLLILFSSVLWSAAMIDIKVLGRTESSRTIAAYVTVLLTPLTLVPALFVWQTPSVDMWVWLVFIGVVGTIGQFAVTEALKLGDMTALMPFDFLKLVWATFLGIIFFAEVPDFLTWVGAAIVFGSSFYIAWREATLRRLKANP